MVKANKKDDDYKIVISGITISKKDGNKFGLGMIFGLLGAGFSFFVFGDNKPVVFLTIAICFSVGVIFVNWVSKK